MSNIKVGRDYLIHKNKIDSIFYNSKKRKLMGFWKEVDIEIRSRMNTFKTSYEDEKKDAIKIIANERYGKK